MTEPDPVLTPEQVGDADCFDDRIAPAYTRLYEAVRAFGAWMPFLEKLDVRGPLDDDDAASLARAWDVLAALRAEMEDE
jgi:hypothetical protein